MKKMTTILLNGLFLLFVSLVAFVIATISLTKKVNQYTNQFNQGVNGIVLKQQIPVVAFAGGVVEKVFVKTGDEVSKDQNLARLQNPALLAQVKTLKRYPDNVSAQTQQMLLETELDNMNIISPVDGIVGNVDISPGSGISDNTKLMTVYSNDNIRFFAQLTVDQYHTIQQLNEVIVYSPRLHQSFSVRPGVLSPEEIPSTNTYDPNKIGLFFNFVNKEEAQSLLDKENLQLRVNKPTQVVNKPIDLFVQFWNGLIGIKQT